MTERPLVHVVGAGLAGLSAAVRLAEAGRPVRLYEAGSQAGGRCRSYVDEVLGCRIDNGNHLLLSGNDRALAYLATIGALDTLAGPKGALFPFVDLQTGERWTVRPNRGRIPYWLLDPSRRVRGSTLGDYGSALKLAFAGPEATVASLFAGNPLLYRRFWQPLAVSVLNTEAEEASAQLLWPVLRETFGRGADHCRPLIAAGGLSESFVYPALDWLAAHGVDIRFGARVRAIGYDDSYATTLDLGGETVALGPGEQAVVAVTPPVAATLVPGITVPTDFRCIVNAHFRLSEATPEVAILGVIGSATEWIFRHGELVSVTISAATRFLDVEGEALARIIWSEVATALGLGDRPLPPWRLIKEKRATFAQTPEQVKLRPPTATRWRNLVLAGDYIENGLPVTIEGTIRNGEAAARALLRR
jgi:squalene-associated FAD-dependent desaturase